ncbi:MAG TPA: YhbY family RNA-binding protein [Polyangia bacterium]|jgi:RNA-binding protein|nr:YhbY family RNA-binding protein [Polyangia bacterium]
MPSPANPPTNPKKKSLMPSGKLRQSLRGYGHALSPLVQVGKAGVTHALVRQVNDTLADHELVKIKVGSESPVDRFQVAERLGEEPGVEVVQILGRMVLLYKRHPQQPKYEGKRAVETAEKARARAGRPALETAPPPPTSKRTPPKTPAPRPTRPPAKPPKPGIVRRMAAKRAAASRAEHDEQ